MRTLDGVSTRSFAVSGVDLLHGSNVLDLRMGTVQGIYNLFLGQRTGDGDLMRSRFWVGCGCFFLRGTGEGKRSSRVRVPEKFSQDERTPNSPVRVIYIIC
jgi:hypothetical protein